MLGYSFRSRNMAQKEKQNEVILQYLRKVQVMLHFNNCHQKYWKAVIGL